VFSRNWGYGRHSLSGSSCFGKVTLPAAAALAGMIEAGFLAVISRVEPFLADGLIAAEVDRPPAPRVSVVIPVYDEEENLPVLYSRLVDVLYPLGSYEIIFVDDGSRDGSAQIVDDLERRDPGVRVVRLSRNFGHQAALSAGLNHARRNAVVLMDADLRDPPKLLPELMERWESGYQLVYAVREKRDEGLAKRATARLFYRLLRAAADVGDPRRYRGLLLDGSPGGRRAVPPPGAEPVPARVALLGRVRQIGVPYERPPRHAGEVKYTARQMVKLALNGLLAFTSLPLRLASYLGFLTAAAGVVYLAVAVFARLFTGSTPAGWTSLVALILIVGGAQLIVTGVLGAYVARIYDETKGRPMYVVDRGIPRDGRP
jgi:polyisoprenyl-phosphate glycosyltransferase